MMETIRPRSVLILLVLALALASLAALYTGQPAGGDAVRQAFLAEDAEFDDYLALLAQPALIQERAVQAKLMRAFRSPELDQFKAAAAVAMRVPELDFKAPRVWRRLETSFLGRDVGRKVSLLELANDRVEYREDLRVVGLVAEALLEKDSDLAQMALGLAENNPRIAANPAVAEALSSVHGKSIQLAIPDFEGFQSEIVPILTTPGGDATACVECHKNRTIMRLRPAEEVGDEVTTARHYYRSLLRVIDLKDPEKSMLLAKPTRPAPQTQPAPASLKTHTGGARFQVGDETYQKIIKWISSGH